MLETITIPSEALIHPLILQLCSPEYKQHAKLEQIYHGYCTAGNRFSWFRMFSICMVSPLLLPCGAKINNGGTSEFREKKTLVLVDILVRGFAVMCSLTRPTGSPQQSKTRKIKSDTTIFFYL